MNMRAFDLSPLYRASVGFDRLASTLNTMSRGETAAPSYPPFNVEKTGEDAYRITLAVAGFDPIGRELVLGAEGGVGLSDDVIFFVVGGEIAGVLWVLGDEGADAD